MKSREKFSLVVKSWLGNITVDDLIDKISTPVYLGEVPQVQQLFRKRVGLLSPQAWSTDLTSDFIHKDRMRIRYCQHEIGEGKDGYVAFPKNR